MNRSGIRSGIRSGPLRIILVAGLCLAISAAAWYALWSTVRKDVVRAPRYRIALENIRLTPAPDWIHADIRGEVLRDASLDGPQSILDSDLAKRLHDAFSAHPWVARVERVYKRSPARIEIDVVYRRPVCMVQVPGGLYPVDVEGVLLPGNDFTPQQASQYPRLSAVLRVTEGPVGTPWRDERVRGAAQIAALLNDDWKRLQLSHIEPISNGPISNGPISNGPISNGPISNGNAASDQSEIQFAIMTLDGSRLLWGAPPGTQPEHIRRQAGRLVRLKRLFAELGSWSEAGRPREFDLRDSRVQAKRNSTASERVRRK